MSLIELWALALGLSMDAFAVSVCKGLAVKQIKFKHMLLAGLWFGGFQALMPLLGFFLGSAFAEIIANYDHWIAFVLLALIGGNMIKEALSHQEEENVTDSFGVKTMLLMAVATSIDALAVGVTFAFLQVHILPAISVIGLTTFLLSFAGVKLGNAFGARYEKKAQFVGGVILVLIGVKILLEHLGVL